jgi:dihydroxyacetone kinase-like predicted kinase
LDGGIIDGDIEVVAHNVESAAQEAIQKMIDDDSEIVTIIFGEGTKAKVAQKLKAFVEELDDGLEVEVHDGGQPLYPFFISVE